MKVKYVFIKHSAALQHRLSPLANTLVI